MLILQDVRYALRGFRKNPAFTAIAILTLTVGIAANASIFSVMNALLLRQLPYAQPDRLAYISADRKINDRTQGPLSWVRYSMIESQNRSFERIGAFTFETFSLTGRGDPEQLNAARVTANFLDVLGVKPAAGRWFSADEDKPGGPNAAVISHALWTRRFGASRSVIGQSITLDAKQYTVTGVLPAGFQFQYFGPIDIVTTRVFELSGLLPQQVTGGAMFLNAVARLRPEASFNSAQAEMDAMASQYRREHPRFPDADPGLVVHVEGLRDSMVIGVRVAVLILFGAVGLVLLIACANVAALLLSRALGRSREIAVRTAIGATRAAIIRQLLTESVLLALTAGMIGTALSSWGTRTLAAMAQNNLPRATEIHTDPQVLAFTIGISFAAGILFGLAPALQISRPDVNSILRSEGRGGTSGRRSNALRNLLVISQVALSVILLIGAGLLLRSFLQLRGANPGFDPHNILTANITLPFTRYNRPAQIVFFGELLRRVRALPGVQSAAAATALPVNPARFSPALPEGQPQVPLGERPVFHLQMLSPNYASAMRIQVVKGREFTDADTPTSPQVAMVNEAVARRFWHNQNPVGKYIVLGAVVQVEVVGVLKDIQNLSVSSDVKPEIFMPMFQRSGASINLIIRTAQDPHALVSPLRAAVSALDRDQPITAVQTMDEVLDSGAAQPRFTATLLTALSATALILAIVGIYGSIAYSVTERTREMGIRIALGADSGSILTLVMRQGLTLAGTGIAIGLAASFALTRMLNSLVYNMSVTDPVTFIGCAVLFVGVALAASYVPARRAMRVDPIVTLR